MMLHNKWTDKSCSSSRKRRRETRTEKRNVCWMKGALGESRIFISRDWRTENVSAPGVKKQTQKRNTCSHSTWQPVQTPPVMLIGKGNWWLYTSTHLYLYFLMSFRWVQVIYSRCILAQVSYEIFNYEGLLKGRRSCKLQGYKSHCPVIIAPIVVTTSLSRRNVFVIIFAPRTITASEEKLNVDKM